MTAPSTLAVGSPTWAPPRASLLVEIRSGVDDAALVVALCGCCGVELQAEQTHIPRALVAKNHLDGDGRLVECLAGWAILRLGKRHCECGASLPGPTTTYRIELPD